MAKFLEPSDFVGKYKISQNCYDENTLNSYINKYEDLYICQLLGSEMTADFYADLDVDNLPQAPKYQTLFNPFCKDIQSYNWFTFYSGQNCILRSEGFVEMLKGFIYYHYVTAENVRHTITGLTKTINENTSGATYEMIYRTAEIRYNESMASFNDIQYYICENLGDYPNWNGVKLNSKFYGVL